MNKLKAIILCGVALLGVCSLATAAVRAEPARLSKAQMKEIRGGIMYVLAYTGTASNYALVVVTPTFGTGGTGQVWDWSAGGGATKMGYSPSFDPYNKDTTYYNFCGGPLAGVRTSINPGSFTVVANPSGAAIPW